MKHSTDTGETLDVYAVGWLAAWQHRKIGHLRNQWRYTLGRLRKRNWRAIRNSLNGYLAEPYQFPPGVHRCGIGWTKGLALRSYERQVRKAVRDAH